MTHDDLLNYCLKMKGAYTDFPFGPKITVVKVKKRIFAQIFYLKSTPVVTFNCERLRGEFYRNLYPDAVKRGYHCPPIQQPYFNTINLEMNVPNDVLLQMANHSYSYVTGKLTKKIRQELESE